jgi:tetratricopeptide (TPR) repeat protein
VSVGGFDDAREDLRLCWRFRDGRLGRLELSGSGVAAPDPFRYHLVMGGRKRSEDLAEQLAFHPVVRLGEHHETPYIFDRLCLIIDAMVTNGDRDSLRAARRAVRIAGRLAGPGRCKLCAQRLPGSRPKTVELARGFGRLAAALRLWGRYGHAEAALVTAFKMDPPTEIQGDLYRRRAILRLYQEQEPEAVADACTALLLATPGQRRGRALKTLGVASYETGSFKESILHLEEAVETLDPDLEHSFIAALVCYANALAKGTGEDVRKGLTVCAKARGRLKKSHKIQRAKLWWVEGLLYHRLSADRDAWRCLNTARLSLVLMKIAPEVAVITADMARIAMQPHTVENMCFEAIKAIPDHHPLSEPLQALRCAGRSEIPAAAGVLREAADGLAVCPPSR